ncbi:major facilitator superfamily domain-containing protein [Obelidium mucronatum]|nr:major facilitator superfamily domain-containing protein [Obelidium mucronatum]
MPEVAEQGEETPAKPWHRISDVIVLSVGFVFVFMTFTVLQNMGSTILVPSVAFRSLGTLYVSFAFFNMFAAAAVVERIGCRAALFFASLGYSLFAVANVVALSYEGDLEMQIWVLQPAAALTGLSASVLWAAQGVYVTRCARSQDVGKYTGVFFGVFWWASILGPMLTRLLLAGSSDNLDVFAKLTGVGACGPLVLLWLWVMRPEPNHPDCIQQQPAAAVDNVSGGISEPRFKFLKTFRIMFTRSMFLLAPLYYSTSVEQAFSGGSLPLFINSGDSKIDLEHKLYLQAAFGTTLMITSFIIGGITDRFGSRPLVVIDFFIHVATMAVLWFLKPVNNLPVLFTCAVVLAMSDSLLMNQIYKLVGTLYPQKHETSTAFAAYKFHQSLGIGIAFVSSKSMLGDDGVPNMAIWMPLMSLVLLAATIGVLLATQKPARSAEVVDEDGDENTPLLAGASHMDTAQEIELKRDTNRLGDVFVLATAFFFIFSAFTVIQGLASSVLPKSVAFMTLGALYFSFAFCNLFLAAPIVDWIGCRFGLFLASITYSIFNINTIVALKTNDALVQTSILIPAAILNGLGASVLWAAESVYVTKCACKHTIGRYAGYFFSFVGLAGLAGPFFSSFLLQLNYDKIQVFEILCCIGSLGPLLTVYILWRPAPSNPYDIPNDPPAPHPPPSSSTNSMFKTFNTMLSPSILLIAPISYFTSCQMAFNGGSIPLFINTGNVSSDLRMKLYMVACAGAVTTITSAVVGRFTDFYGPRVMLLFALVLYSVTMGTMWWVNPYNDLVVLFSCVVLFAFCSGIVANQNYKMMGVLFPGTATAFAAQRFHSSLATALAFMTSGLMLTSEGIPNMNIWSPLILGCLVVGTVGAFVVTRDERFLRRV